MKDKRGFMNQIAPLALAIITLAVLIGIGITILYNLGGSQAICGNATFTYDYTRDKCWNGSVTNRGILRSSATFTTELKEI